MDAQNASKPEGLGGILMIGLTPAETTNTVLASGGHRD